MWRAALIVLVVAAGIGPGRASEHDEREHQRALDRAAHPVPALHLGSIEDAARAGASDGPGPRAAEAARRGATGLTDAAQAVLHMPWLAAQVGYRHSAQGSGPEVVVGLTQEVPLRGLGRGRRQAAQATRSALEHELAAARALGAARAATAWIEVVEAHAILGLRDRALQAAETLAKVARRRVEVGTAHPAEAALGDTERGRAAYDHLEAEGRLVEASAELAIAVGRSPGASPTTPLAFPEAPTPIRIDDAALARLADASPGVLALVARARAAEAQVTIAAATNGPTALVGGNYQREGNGDQVGVAQLGVGLPVVDPARFDRAERRVDAAVAEAAIGTARTEVVKALFLARHDTEHYLELLEAIEHGTLVPAREAVRLAEKGFLAGTAPIEVLLLARQRLLAAEDQAVRARAELARAHLRFALATGSLGGTT